MIDFSQLGSIVGDAHERLISIYYILLPIFFMISLVTVWFTTPTGGPEFLDKLKRVIVATLLLVAFPEITDAILFLSNWITSEISGLDGKKCPAILACHSKQFSKRFSLLVRRSFLSLKVCKKNYRTHI